MERDKEREERVGERRVGERDKVRERCRVREKEREGEKEKCWSRRVGKAKREQQINHTY